MKKSFTLIELIVVISISIIFLGLVLPRYNDYSGQLKLRNEAKKLIDVLELAKKKALSADLIPTPGAPKTFCTDFTGYQITLSPPGSYSLKYCCDSVCTTNINTYTLNTNNTIVSPASSTNLIFTPLMSGVNLTVGSIRLKNSAISGTNQCIDISVSPIGIVELNETLVGC
ncbi:MAG: hypothetical protein AAB441_03100 [Patescibacteria group bacterium]